MNLNRIIEWICRLIIGVVFIWAGAGKILAPCELAVDVYKYQLAPGMIINITAIILPYVEIILGICLIVGVAPRGAALGLNLVLLFFTIMLTINLIRGIEFNCGCFGKSETDWCQIFTNWKTHGQSNLNKVAVARLRTGCDVIRDIILLVPGITSFILLRKRLDKRS
jgi:putative oxidoreductase